MKILKIIFLATCFVFFQNASANNTSFKEDFFKNQDGCFICFDLKNNINILTINEKKSTEPLSPCSTFKIFNSLAALDSKVLKNENSLKIWEGNKYSITSWNKNHTLKSAIRNSVVWYFKEVAKDIGTNRMQNYLNRANYGNKDISGGITKFWLNSSLKITPKEQIQFMKRLYSNKLPFSSHAVEITKSILILEKTNKYTFSGKTGTCFQNYGWFLGHISSDKGEYVFCCLIQGRKATGPKAREISKKILTNLKLIN
ncbi:MAG: penicillin-binding transpeptidase domain-containing protein [Candidatus Thorarchaeota archaeon]